ncbi:hypothetical protein C5B42_03750 [Candidatus Cerribacteria bacterium 'Amazon FNV 2010 28 9']|uniref:N-acetyltransferase domain-containing protein n=1 Tax=Candidatus Cerribacteria bacterium 'Amazon FNV 2010 28 9' TaxID=2081795 RepID=A0A317JR67_9BACT|nr:MAG: hypothetical protein C5B42_03750 [Candidatus Cerribacteria bacterium 'Amazon FNV 2010 28 9']
MNEFHIGQLVSEQIGESIEHSPLADLLLAQLSLLYEGFPQWLEKTIRDLNNGKRIAIGAWENNTVSQLEGVCILKPVDSINLELKTLYVCPDHRGKIVQLCDGREMKISHALLQAADEYIQTHGFEVVLADAPSQDKMIEKLLLQYDFLLFEGLQEKNFFLKTYE